MRMVDSTLEFYSGLFFRSALLSSTEGAALLRATHSGAHPTSRPGARSSPGPGSEPITVGLWGVDCDSPQKGDLTSNSKTRSRQEAGSQAVDKQSSVEQARVGESSSGSADKSSSSAFDESSSAAVDVSSSVQHQARADLSDALSDAVDESPSAVIEPYGAADESSAGEARRVLGPNVPPEQSGDVLSDAVNHLHTTAVKARHAASDAKTRRQSALELVTPDVIQPRDLTGNGHPAGASSDGVTAGSYAEAGRVGGRRRYSVGGSSSPRTHSDSTTDAQSSAGSKSTRRHSGNNSVSSSSNHSSSRSGDHSSDHVSMHSGSREDIDDAAGNGSTNSSNHSGNHSGSRGATGGDHDAVGSVSSGHSSSSSSSSQSRDAVQEDEDANLTLPPGQTLSIKSL